MTGEELYRLRDVIGKAVIGRRLTAKQMARLCGLTDPDRNGANTIHKYEKDGPSGPVAALLETFAQIADPTASVAFRETISQMIRKRLR